MSANLPKLAPHDALRAIAGSSKALAKMKKVDPRDRYVLLYPNSDKAHVGMGFNLLKVKPAEAVYQEASEFLKKDILKLCLKGPREDLLGSLENRNLATYVTSHATMAKLAQERNQVIPLCKAAGGIGVGFVNSLVFGGAMSFEDGLDLVQRQAQAMDKAASIVPNSKLKIHVRAATRKRKVCQAAVDYCIKQGIPQEIAVCSVTKQIHAHVIEVGGHEEAIKFLEREGERLFEFKAIKRITNSPNAYHTELMRPAKDFLSAYVNQKLKEKPDYLKEPESCSVFSATAGRRLRSINNIKKDLLNYPVHSLKVEQLLHCLFARPDNVPQPNVLVLWDKFLHRNLMMVNRKAWASSKLLQA